MNRSKKNQKIQRKEEITELKRDGEKNKETDKYSSNEHHHLLIASSTSTITL